MIDWDESAELNNCTVSELVIRFERFPKSAKMVVSVCDICGEERSVKFCNYFELCHTCGNGTPETRKLRSESATERCADPEWRKVHSDRIARWNEKHPGENSASQILYNKDHPEKGRIHSEYKKQWCIDNPEKLRLQGIAHSEIMKKHYADMDDPGSEIVNHHYLYDHSDLSKNVVGMTRSDHMKLHNLLRGLKYTVPHINITGE